MTILSLDIGATIGWALINCDRETVTDKGQIPYAEPGTCNLPLPKAYEYEAAVIEEPSGIAFTRVTDGKDASKVRGIAWSCAKNRERAIAWKNYLLGRSVPVFMVKDRKSKAKRLAELCGLTATAQHEWRQHEADAAAHGLTWVRKNKAKQFAAATTEPRRSKGGTPTGGTPCG